MKLLHVIGVTFILSMDQTNAIASYLVVWLLKIILCKNAFSLYLPLVARILYIALYEL